MKNTLLSKGRELILRARGIPGTGLFRRLGEMERRIQVIDRQLHDMSKALAVIREHVVEEVHRNATHLGAHLSARLAEEVHRNAAHVDEHLSVHLGEAVHRNATHLGEHLSARLAEEVHRYAAHVDEHLSAQIGELGRRHIPELIAAEAAEQRTQQNRYFSRDNPEATLAAKQYYLQLKAYDGRLDFDEVGVSVFSQNNEDGIVLYIFSRIGMRSRRSIEIGCDLSGSTIGVPEGNTINLITNFGFDGLIIDMDEEKIGSIGHFFARALSTKHLHAPARDGIPAHYFSPALVARKITVHNVNDVFRAAGFIGEIDLLSIDIDGEDVAVWNAVDVISPRVVMVEVNNRLRFSDVFYGKASASQAPHDTLEWQASWGSSLGAACEAAAAKGYVFVGMGATLINAFFVRQDVWVIDLPERRAADYLSHRMNPLLDPER